MRRRRTSIDTATAGSVINTTSILPEFHRFLENQNLSIKTRKDTRAQSHLPP